MNRERCPAHRWIAVLFLTIALQPTTVWPDRLKPYQQPVPAPELILPDLSGELHDLKAYRGDLVIINFWASWCAPCLREMPALERIAKRLAERGGRVLAINAGESPRHVERFLRRNPLDLMILLDKQSMAVTGWEVQSMPTSFIVDPSGRIVGQVVGEYPWDDPALLDQILGYRQ